MEIIAGDLRDEDAIRKAVQGQPGGFPPGGADLDPVFLLSIQLRWPHTNITGTMNVLLACRDFGVERLVHTSTSEVYGTARIVPINEDHPLQGQSPYSASKIGADKLAESYLLRVRFACDHGTAIQYLWSASICPGGHPHHHHPGTGDWTRSNSATWIPPVILLM